MIREKKEERNSNTLKIVGVFLLLVTVLIGISFIIRIISVASKSTFDGHHRYTVQIDFESKKSEVLVATFAPDAQNVSVIIVKKVKSPTEIGKYLEVPIDARLSFPKAISTPSTTMNKDSFAGLFSNAVFRYSQTNSKGATIIDVMRLWWFANSLPSHAFSTDVVTTKLPDSAIDKISTLRFLDTAITSENITIEIVNGTAVGGLGNRFARLVTNMGGNVVRLSTDDTSSKKTRIRHIGKGASYTVSKLKKILGLDEKSIEDIGIVSKKQPILLNSLSDITVIIGEDKASTQIF